nr:sodium/hydrogen exchanger 4 isoform X2 [Ipomoea batatas]
MRVLEYAGTNLGSSTPNHEQVVPITVFVALLCLCLVVGHLLEDNRWFNESIAAIFIVLNQEETPLLYSLVFGEGVVNDATSVVLFNAIQKIDVNRLDGWALVSVLLDFLYLFSTSTALGVGVGLLTSFILRVLYFGRHAFATLSFIAETFIFLYVGMDALDIEKWKMSDLSVWKSAAASGIVLLVTLVGRAAFVFPLSALSNCMNRNRTRSSSITFKHQVIIWWAGLMRGAVSIALAFNQFTFYGITLNPTHATMVTITIIVVLFSTIVFGFLTKPLVCCLLPCYDSNIDQEPSVSHESNLDREPSISKDDDVRLPLLSFEESAATNILRAKDSLSMLIERPAYTVHSYWRRFDDAYMRPIFGGPHSQRHESSR